MKPNIEDIRGYLAYVDADDRALQAEKCAVLDTLREVGSEPLMSFDLSPADVLQLLQFNRAHELQQLRDKARNALTITEAPENTQAVPEPPRTMVAEPDPSKPSPTIDMPINPRYWLLAVAISLVLYGVIAGLIMTVRTLWR